MDMDVGMILTKMGLEVGMYKGVSNGKGLDM
jgi:hypothetical protein